MTALSKNGRYWPKSGVRRYRSRISDPKLWWTEIQELHQFSRAGNNNSLKFHLQNSDMWSYVPTGLCWACKRVCDGQLFTLLKQCTHSRQTDTAQYSYSEVKRLVRCYIIGETYSIIKETKKWLKSAIHWGHLCLRNNFWTPQSSNLIYNRSCHRGPSLLLFLCSLITFYRYCNSWCCLHWADPVLARYETWALSAATSNSALLRCPV